MSEMITKKKFEQIMSVKNKDERQKMRLTRDMMARKVDIIRDRPRIRTGG